MCITSMANFGFNSINNNYQQIKSTIITQFNSGKILNFASKIKSIKNTTISFIKKNPRNITTCIGLASMLAGVTTVNPGLVCVGISALVAATLYIPPSVTPSPNQENKLPSQYPEAG